MQLGHLAPAAQVLKGLSVHQSWAWEVCCLTFVHPCLAEKSLHIGRLCIQSLNACPDSPVVPHASTHTCTDNLGPWEPSLRHPQMPVSVLLHTCSCIVPTAQCLIIRQWSKFCSHSHLHTDLGGLYMFHSCTLKLQRFHVFACLHVQAWTLYIPCTIRKTCMSACVPAYRHVSAKPSGQRGMGLTGRGSAMEQLST